jgi:hypothetical protein
MEGSQQGEPKADTVETVWGIAEAVLDDERERGKNLDTKTASLAAFSGTILALDATLGQSLLKRDLGCVGNVTVPAFFLLAAAALLLAACVAVLGVLYPQKFRGLDDKELQRFATLKQLTRNKEAVQGSMLSTLVADVIPAERARNNKKVRLTKVSAVALGVGLLGIAGQAVTLGLHEIGV